MCQNAQSVRRVRTVRSVRSVFVFQKRENGLNEWHKEMKNYLHKAEISKIWFKSVIVRVV